MTIGNFGEYNLSTLIAVIVSSLTVLSYFLSVNEYFNKKAYWDYYHVHDKCREGMRSGFHAEHLTYAAVIMLLFGTIFFIVDHFWKYTKKFWLVEYIIVCCVVLTIIYFADKILIWKFHLTDVNERFVWKSKIEYKAFVSTISKLHFKEYGICCSIALLGIFISIRTSSLLVFVPFLISAFVFMQFENYSNQQILLSYRKWVDITHHDRKLYAVIEEKQDFYYLVKCEIENEKIKLYLDKFLILKTDSLKVQTRYFSSMERYCNSYLCNNHYKVSYRDEIK